MQSTYDAHTFGDSDDHSDCSNDCCDWCDYSKDYSKDSSNTQCFYITCKDEKKNRLILLASICMYIEYGPPIKSHASSPKFNN